METYTLLYVLREEHGNIYITMCKIDSQWEFGV